LQTLDVSGVSSASGSVAMADYADLNWHRAATDAPQNCGISSQGRQECRASERSASLHRRSFDLCAIADTVYDAVAACGLHIRSHRTSATS
jgi:hypothetical protein